jgi:hypothetical protein
MDDFTSREERKSESIKRMQQLGLEAAVKMSNGKLDVENFVAAIRGIHYNGF